MFVSSCVGGQLYCGFQHLEYLHLPKLYQTFLNCSNETLKISQCHVPVLDPRGVAAAEEAAQVAAAASSVVIGVPGPDLASIGGVLVLPKALLHRVTGNALLDLPLPPPPPPPRTVDAIDPSRRTFSINLRLRNPVEALVNRK